MRYALAALIAFTFVAGAFAAVVGEETVHVGTLEVAKEEPKTLWSDDFEAYDPTVAWDGGGQWKVGVAKDVNVPFAIGEEFANGEGRGLRILNTSEGQVGKVLGWGGISRQLKEVAGKERFVLSFDFMVPTKTAADKHRVDMNLTEIGTGGRGLLFLELAPWGINFIYRDPDKEGTRKMLYVRGQGGKVGEWNTVALQIDQAKDRFRVTINGKAVTGERGEWAYFRYDHDAKPERTKVLGFTTADGWKGSRRYIDNVKITEPTEAWEIPAE